jgi:hypothetical protein
MLASIGLLAGVETTRAHGASPAKLINLVGLFFDLFAVLLLTYILASSERTKKIAARFVGTFAIAIVTEFPILYFVGIIIGTTLLSGADHGIFSIVGVICFCGWLSRTFIESFVRQSYALLPDASDFIIKFLGGYFLVAGLLVQIYAGFLDVGS